MKLILLIFLCMPFAQREKLKPIRTISLRANRILWLWDDKGRTKSGDTMFLICSKFMKLKKDEPFVLMGSIFISEESTQLQYFTIGRFVAIRKKQTLEITWE